MRELDEFITLKDPDLVCSRSGLYSFDQKWKYKELLAKILVKLHKRIKTLERKIK